MVIFGILTIASAIGVIVSTKPLNSALWLVMTLFLMAVHFGLLGADFMAAMQILIYAGAIMVLVIFVIMLLGLQAEEDERGRLQWSRIVAALASGGFIATFVVVVSQESMNLISFLPKAGIGKAEGFGSPEAVGEVMFTKFMLPFEMIGLLLLAAIIGACLLAYDKKRPLPEGRGLQAKRRSR